MSPAPVGIEARVRTLAEEVVARAGYELIDVEYRREPRGWTLRLFIDKQGGVNLDDCQRVSQELGTVLEVEDPIPHRFNLEVSSPGLDRPLAKERDFLEALGRTIRVAVREPIAGQRNFTGRLVRAETDPPRPTTESEAAAGGLTLHLVDEAGVERTIPVSAVERARLIFEWPRAGARGPAKPGGRAGRKR